MSVNVSEFVWRRLSQWGLKRVYGYPGDGVGGLDGAPTPKDGVIRPDLTRPGNGLVFKHQDAARYAA